MRFGSPWVGGFEGRAMVPQGFWDPLITNFQRQPHTTAHRPPEHLVTPCAQSAVADNKVSIKRYL